MIAGVFIAVPLLSAAYAFHASLLSRASFLISKGFPHSPQLRKLKQIKIWLAESVL